MVKNLPVKQETQVGSLGWEDPLKKKMATDPSILAWRIPWTEEPCGLQFMGSQRLGQDLAAKQHAASQQISHAYLASFLCSHFWEEEEEKKITKYNLRFIDV